MEAGITAAYTQGTGTLVNADIASGAAIAYSKLALAGSIVTGDIANGTIVDADISAAAAISASKLAVDNLLPWLIDIDVFPTAIAQTNFDVISSPAAAIYNFQKASTGAQNAEINWDVVLAAGTWTVDLIHHTNSDTGIYTIQFDGVTKGTIDGYSAGDVVNVRTAVAGIAVAATAKVRLKLLIATKNASSSNFNARLQHVQLRRTA